MKYIIPVLALLCLAACSKQVLEDEKIVCQEVEYDANIDIQIDDEICFPDGNTLTLSSVDHQFCPCGAVCIWAGDLYITMSTSSDLGDMKEKIFFPSSLDFDRSIFDNYEISSFSYTYDSNDGEVPACAEDYEPEKITLTISISKL